jgi:hypothetical protein
MNGLNNNSKNSIYNQNHDPNIIYETHTNINSQNLKYGENPEKIKNVF